MALFDYLAIAFSVLFALAGTRLVGGLPHAVESLRRYWIHLGFVCFQLLITVAVFWIFWSFRTVVWTFPMFLLVLASPGLIYYNACTLIPENPSAVESWRDYYYAVRRRYFIGLSCWIVTATVISTIVLQIPFAHPARASQVGFLAAGLVGAVSANERVHSVLVLFFLLSSLLAIFTFLLRPGVLATP